MFHSTIQSSKIVQKDNKVMITGRIFIRPFKTKKLVNNNLRF